MSPSTASQPVSFHDAVERMRAALRTEKHPDTIVWIAPEDLIAAKSRLYVLMRDPNRRWMQAQCRYDVGLDRKLGIVLRLLCQAPGVSCCQVYIPKNSSEAAEKLPANGVQYDVPQPARRAIPVINRLRWRWLKLTGRPEL